MSLSEATGAPAHITIGEKIYQASPLSLLDLGAIEETVRALLLCEELQPAPGALGRIAYDGPVPRSFTLTFKP